MRANLYASAAETAGRDVSLPDLPSTSFHSFERSTWTSNTTARASLPITRRPLMRATSRTAVWPCGLSETAHRRYGFSRTSSSATAVGRGTNTIVDKARRYGRLDKPSVIAVNALDKWSLEPSEVIEALFGEETLTINPEDLASPRQGRAPNGAWTSASGPRYTRNSAVLVAHGLNPWNIGQAELRLYHNPWAEQPYTSALVRIAQAIPRDGVIDLVDGVNVAELLGLPPGWPKEEQSS